MKPKFKLVKENCFINGLHLKRNKKFKVILIWISKWQSPDVDNKCKSKLFFKFWLQKIGIFKKISFNKGGKFERTQWRPKVPCGIC